MSYTPDTYTDYKNSARVATTTTLPAYSHSAGVLTASSNGAFPSVDGVSLALNDRILVKDETAGNAPYNGLYFLSQVGDGSNPWVLTRTRDADQNFEITSGMQTTVEEGTLNGDKKFLLTTNGTIVLGTTALTYEEASGASNLSDQGDVDVSGVVDGALLRYDTGTWYDTTTLLVDSNGQLQSSVTGPTGGVLLGGDVLLYRSAADTLSLDAGDSLQVQQDPEVDNDVTRKAYVNRRSWFGV